MNTLTCEPAPHRATRNNRFPTNRQGNVATRGAHLRSPTSFVHPGCGPHPASQEPQLLLDPIVGHSCIASWPPTDMILNCCDLGRCKNSLRLPRPLAEPMQGSDFCFCLIRQTFKWPTALSVVQIINQKQIHPNPSLLHDVCATVAERLKNNGTRCVRI